jgi:hypothetical protein
MIWLALEEERALLAQYSLLWRLDAAEKYRSAVLDARLAVERYDSSGVIIHGGGVDLRLRRR